MTPSEKAVEEKRKFIEFLETYLDLCTGGIISNTYITIPSLMKSLSKKWNVRQKDVKDYISKLLFNNGDIFVSLCKPRRWTPKTHTIYGGMTPVGRIAYYFVHISAKHEGTDELGRFTRSDLNRLKEAKKQ